jgi:hypothetical protein
VIDAITATIDPYVLHEEMERWGATTFVSKLGEDAVTKTERFGGIFVAVTRSGRARGTSGGTRWRGRRGRAGRESCQPTNDQAGFYQ